MGFAIGNINVLVVMAPWRSAQWRTVRACKVFTELPGILEKIIFLKKLILLKPKIQYSHSILHEISMLDCHY